MAQQDEKRQEVKIDLGDIPSEKMAGEFENDPSFDKFFGTISEWMGPNPGEGLKVLNEVVEDGAAVKANSTAMTILTTDKAMALYFQDKPSFLKNTVALHLQYWALLRKTKSSLVPLEDGLRCNIENLAEMLKITQQKSISKDDEDFVNSDVRNDFVKFFETGVIPIQDLSAQWNSFVVEVSESAAAWQTEVTKMEVKMQETMQKHKEIRQAIKDAKTAKEKIRAARGWFGNSFGYIAIALAKSGQDICQGLSKFVDSAGDLVKKAAPVFADMVEKGQKAARACLDVVSGGFKEMKYREMRKQGVKASALYSFTQVSGNVKNLRDLLAKSKLVLKSVQSMAIDSAKMDKAMSDLNNLMGIGKEGAENALSAQSLRKIKNELINLMNKMTLLQTSVKSTIKICDTAQVKFIEELGAKQEK